MSTPLITLIHSLLFLALMLGGQPLPQTPPKEPLVVQTITLKPAPKPKPVAAKKPSPKAKPKPKPVAQKQQKGPDPKLVALMKQSLDTLETVSAAPPKLTSKPLTVAYESELIAFLESALTLPDTGDVTLDLTILRDGKIILVKTKSGTEKNQTYVKKELATLVLPPFGGRLKGKKQETFPITLTSSE